MSESVEEQDQPDELAPLTDQIADSLPAGWALETLGSLCMKSQYGWTTKADKDGAGVKFLRTTDITPDVVDWDRVPFCVEPPPDLDKYLVKDGDILISRTGSIGVNYLVTKPEPAVFASYLIRFRPKKTISAKYLKYYLQSPAYWRAINAGKKGIAVQNVNANTLSRIPVPVAPPAEQDEIVAEIEKQFSRLDEAVANLQRVKANLKRYKAAVLKAAVEGCLVETEASLAHREGRSYETGEQLLQRILEARRSQWAGRSKYKQPSDAEQPENLVVPAGWAVASLDMLSIDSGYGTSQKCAYENAGPPVLRIPNVQNAILDLQDVKFAPSDFKLTEYDAVQQGDMLIIRTNGSKSLIGRAAVVLTEQVTRMSFASYLIRFRLTLIGHVPAWVSLVWQTSKTREWIEAQAATSAGQHNVSMTVLARAAIPVPPVLEQERIIAEVDRQLTILRGIEVEVNANLQRAQALRQATLVKAFSYVKRRGFEIHIPTQQPHRCNGRRVR